MNQQESVFHFDFKAWILEHSTNDYNIKLENNDHIQLLTEYGEASIQFTQIEEGTIVEFSIISKKDESVKFYLHFELNDENHAKQLYDEMIETLLNLKNEKTLKVLLSCSAGLTTSMFAEELNSMAEMLGLDYHFHAISYLSIYEEVDQYDVILIAPQIGYMLSRLKESLPEKLVLQIPTATFASYDALSAIQFVQNELNIFYTHKKEQKVKESSHCIEYKKRILSIVISLNKAQAKIFYRLKEKCEVIDSHLIIKPSMNIYDLYDIIDTILLKYSYVDIIGIATPGIISDDNQLKNLTYKEEAFNIKEEFEKKYHIDVVICNNANAAAIGFSLEHPEYENIIYHSQQFGFGVGGQGIIVNKKLILGKNGVAGELKYFIHRMQFSDNLHKLVLTEQGALEVVTKSILPAICTMGPEAVAICSPMTPNMEEIKSKLNSFIPEEFLPKFYYIKDASSYMLDGTTQLCVNYLDKKS